MKYGYFDEEAREYVITRPDTPRAWTNYLGDTRYGAVITNHGGGYSFYHSAANGRLLRFRTNAVPDGMPGRLFYLRDRESGAYWSATWQPVGNVEGFESYECRHGTAYTTIKTVTNQIEAETTYFVPLGQAFEVWRLRLTNTSKTPRKLSVFTFCEFTSHWTLSQDLINVQYSAYITKARWNNGEKPGDVPILEVVVNDNLKRDPENFANGLQSRHSWMALLGASLSGFDTEREKFLGPWGTYANPDAVVNGNLTGSLAYGDTACGSFGAEISLAVGETREITVFLGVGEPERAARPVVGTYSDPARVQAELANLKTHWHKRLQSLTVRTPNAAFNQMVNTWGLYNSLITFAWSRAASLVYNGERDGLGYRDTVQDILGVVAAVPNEARERLELMLTGQLSSGGGMPVVRPFDHHPGHEIPPPDEELRSDDCLWLFNTVPAYVNETGDLSFYHKMLPFADSGAATVFGHLRRALHFNLTGTGANHLPCGLAADWNDCLKLGYHGESVFVTFQVRYGLKVYAEIADQIGEPREAAWAYAELEKLDESIRRSCWDGNWFLWAIAEDGTAYGSQKQAEGQIYLNTQSWAVISGAASEAQAESCMKAVHERLATEFGLILCDPPFQKIEFEVMRAVLFNPGTKENASIFNHTQSWAVMAECLLGHGDQAFAYHMAYLPAALNERAEIREIEPYVHCQSTHGKHSERFGRARLPWLTGAATWTYHSATQWILGLRPEAKGLRIDPCISSDWDGFDARRVIRGKTVHIHVANPDGVCNGVGSLTIDGVSVEGSVAPWEMLKDGSKIEATLSGDTMDFTLRKAEHETEVSELPGITEPRLNAV
jgi:cellobiose phosphorylase